MTSKQEATILSLTRKLGLGTRATDGIKAVYGKVPIGFDERKAARVIDELRERYAPIAAAKAKEEMDAAWENVHDA